MITIVSRENTWHDQELLKAGRKKGIEIEIADLFDLEEKQLSQLGEVIVWRSSSLGTGTKKTAALKILKKRKKFFVNNGIIDFPQIVFKSLQQEMMKEFLEKEEVFSIPTFVFKDKKELQGAVTQGKLSFPFIKKPDLGSRGEKVEVISDFKQLNLLTQEEIVGFVFQNFIENKGDYRVFVIGGKPIGIMKRIAQEGSFLNNISQGGRAIEEKSEIVREKLSLAAAKIAAFFDLGLCGVDFIFDEKKKKYYFLEINTVPQWQGFQEATNIDVASLIVDYCNDVLVRRKNRSVHSLIAKNYQEAIIFPDDKKFHFYSRLFLWTRDEKYRKRLEDLKEYFIGGDEEEKQRAKIKFLLINLSENLTQKAINNKKFREKIIRAEFPKLGVFHEILFRNLMAKNIFGADLGKIILEQVSRQELLDLAEKMLKKKKNILALSTFAANYLYFLIFFLEDKSLENKIRKTIKEIVENWKKEDEKYDNKDLLKNNFYFLTHCVIGESRFYFQKIKKEDKTCQKILKILEAIVVNNYFDLSLDNKLEFLVCCRLAGYRTFLAKIIEEEALNSFSDTGNFIIDKWNVNKFRPKGKDFFLSEHRNLLFVLSQLEPNFN